MSSCFLLSWKVLKDSLFLVGFHFNGWGWGDGERRIYIDTKLACWLYDIGFMSGGREYIGFTITVGRWVQ